MSLSTNYSSSMDQSFESDSPLHYKINITSTSLQEMEKQQTGFMKNLKQLIKNLKQQTQAGFQETITHFLKSESIIKIPELEESFKSVNKSSFLKKKLLKDQARQDRNRMEKEEREERKKEQAFQNFKKGKILAEQGKLEQGLIYLIKAVQHYPSQNTYRYSLVVVYSKLKMYEHSLSQLSIILKKDPNMIQAYRKKGDCLHALNRYEEAIQIYRQGLTIQPNDQSCISGIKRSSLHLLNRPPQPLSPYQHSILPNLKHKLSNPSSFTPQQFQQLSLLITKKAIKIVKSK